VNRHRTDWTTLIAGVTFCAIATAYLGADISNRTLEVRWIVPLLLIGLGVAGIAGTVVRGVKRRPTGFPADDGQAGVDVQ
jgi:hypothetical protein